MQKRILIDQGCGPGQIVLPDTLSTGTYTIKAYTNWMKNFLPDNCFLKDIKIYNALSTNEFKEKLYSEGIIKGGVISQTKSGFANSGVTLEVNDQKSDILEIIVYADVNFRSDSNNLFYIFIQTHGNINFVSAEKMPGEATMITIPKDLLSPGVNQITIFNSKGEPVSERYTYTPLKENSFFTLHSVDSCNLREKVTVEIGLENEVAGEQNSINLSVSVAPETNDPGIMDMNDYLVFGTEYGLLPRSIFNNNNSNRPLPQVIDSILLNVRSNWIDWETIVSGNQSHFKYQFEKEDHLLTGKLLTDDQQATPSAEFLLLCVPGKDASFQSTKTDNEGNFSFNLHIDEGFKDLIIMPDDVSEKHKISIESSFSDQYPKSEISVDSVIKQVPPYISEWSVNYQVMKIYGISALGDLLKPVFPSLKPIRFYGKPDIELTIADYMSLPKMEEVFFELLPHVSLKKRNSIYEIAIADRVDDSPYILSPCLLVDGVIIKDASIIANLDPEIVEKIDVIKEKYLVVNYFFPGILNVITKSGDFSCVPLPDYMIRLPYRVIDSVRSFISPDYSSAEMKSSPIPDFRNTLYWNPSIRPDKEGKIRVEFWTSDVVSDYEINLQGITSEGKLISVKKFVNVK